MIRLSLLALLVGCAGEGDPCARGPMSEGEAGLIVTQAEHPTGWGQSSCLGCHALPVLHDQDCTPWVDTERLREQVAADVALEGAVVCTTCHGDNGVEP